MHRPVVLVAAAVAALVYPTSAVADSAGDQLLAEMDAAMNRAQTLVFDFEVLNQEAGKAERTMAMKSSRKARKHLIEFSAPADMKGTKFLVLSPTERYVFLPSFGKVRRIAGAAAEQDFFGLAYSADDLTTTAYGPRYAAARAGEDATTWRLVLTPKAGMDTPYARIEIAVDKVRKLPGELKYFDAQGKQLKAETRTGYSCEGNVCSPAALTMVDSVKGGQTRLVRKSWQVNPSLPDDRFTKRALEK
ncbi:outer membrane lipoprotein-sorting protein [Nannocystis punicea]|uniref:Outer membrane lipoprotein-sorting protein n=1 Tax=Nannocystis punicea TaxID=2995304 RepID=A0ABY7HBN9_9BACT|nr:outer membrane lipoprotein-sorting protein [Nannocystis poenicansa]WAS96527.1 outer membrane lipoprotein-sorting protein [Nannocystis poenicansa]